jgi:hypothetical protein
MSPFPAEGFIFGQRGWNAPHPDNRSEIESHGNGRGRVMPYSKPRSRRPAASDERRVPISVEEPDCGAITEGGGRVEVDIGGDGIRTRKGAVLVIAVRHIPERVIARAWIALPETILAGAGVGEGGLHGAVAVKGYYGSQINSVRLVVITVDSYRGYLPHALDCWTASVSRLIRAPEQRGARSQSESDNCYLRFKFHLLFLWLIWFWLFWPSVTSRCEKIISSRSLR